MPRPPRNTTAALTNPVPAAGKKPAVVELRDLFHLSGMSQQAFGELAGMPGSTFSDLMQGRNPVRPIHLYAAKFTLLRLGHQVHMDPVPSNLLRPKAR